MVFMGFGKIIYNFLPVFILGGIIFIVALINEIRFENESERSRHNAKALEFGLDVIGLSIMLLLFVGKTILKPILNKLN